VLLAQALEESLQLAFLIRRHVHERPTCLPTRRSHTAEASIAPLPRHRNMPVRRIATAPPGCCIAATRFVDSGCEP
jgi:hypothetical protein